MRRLETRFQSPSLRGSGRFRVPGWWTCIAPIMFQSPSLRGSGRFCESDAEALVERLVSIPFIAGQWSLHPGGQGARVVRLDVSIPFIAGQWSLPG